jgi:hypothetical protein
VHIQQRSDPQDRDAERGQQNQQNQARGGRQSLVAVSATRRKTTDE